MRSSDTTILVFDSGVGGLSVAQSILLRLPGIRIVYVADDAAFPYGTKSEAVLKKRILDVILPLQASSQADLVVIACNTASTIILPDLRTRLTIPVVGVVPAIKPAATLSQTRHIGLLATPATINRTYTDQLLNDFAADCRVVRVGSSRLVELAESYLRDDKVDLEALRQIILPFFMSEEAPESSAGLDVIVLGCTHFPLLRQQLAQVAPYPVSWIDSGDAIASRVEQVLGGQNLLPQMQDLKTHHLVFTGNADLSEPFKKHLMGLGFTRFNWTQNYLAFSPSIDQ
ncbi:MAG: glutamate racemase [Hahellaceae bacterium]|nr:glutamate racemase [Hahellaceae bacterium]